jgi:hypothetical protein
LLSFLSLDMNAIAIAKYSSESLAGISMESLERVFPLGVRGVISRRFKVGNTAGEYTGCVSSPHGEGEEKKRGSSRLSAQAHGAEACCGSVGRR